MELREWIIGILCLIGIIVLSLAMPDKGNDDDQITGAGGNA